MEEDEFLAHTAELFEFEGQSELVNNIRYVRDGQMFMPEEAQMLFQHGYLDTFSWYDSHNHKRAMVWEGMDL